MKQILTLVLVFFTAISISAQCNPDLMFADSTGFVFPAPFKDDRPEGGIQDSACINQYYEFVLTLKIPDMINYNGLNVGMEYIEIEPTGAVSGLPDGMSYACNPPSCTFVPDDGMACIIINGTPTNTDDIGDHDLTIASQIKVDILIAPVPVTFPDNNDIIDGADGNYILSLIHI